MAYEKKFDRFLLDVNGLSVGNTTIFTPLYNFVITEIQYMIADTENALTYPTLSIGVTSAAFADISVATAITITNLHEVQNAVITVKKGFVAAGTAVVCRVSVAGTATLGTIDMRPVITGYYSD